MGVARISAVVRMAHATWPINVGMVRAAMSSVAPGACARARALRRRCRSVRHAHDGGDTHLCGRAHGARYVADQRGSGARGDVFGRAGCLRSRESVAEAVS